LPVVVDELVGGGQLEEGSHVDGADALGPVGGGGVGLRGGRGCVACECGEHGRRGSDASRLESLDEREDVQGGAARRSLGAGGEEVGLGADEGRAWPATGPGVDAGLVVARADGEDERVGGESVDGHQLVLQAPPPGLLREDAGAGEDDAAVVLGGLVDRFRELPSEREIVDRDREGSDLPAERLDQRGHGLRLLL
jgi:hypothetical protein